MKLVISVLVATSFSAAFPAHAQTIKPPSLETVRALGLDSSGTVATAYFRPQHRERATHLQTLLRQFLDFAGRHLDVDAKMRVAVVDSVDWMKVTSTPYGLPTNSGLGGDNLLLAAAHPPARVGPRTMPVGEIGDFLLIGHEGGHLITWQLLPEPMKAAASGKAKPSPEVMARFRELGKVPPWYWEMVANYFATAFLRESHPNGADAWVDHLREIADVTRPRFTALDDWFTQVMEATAADSTPYRFSEEGALNQGWYQGVVGQLAAHIYDRAGLDYLPHIRSTLAATRPMTTEALVSEMETIAPGATALLTRLGAQWK